MEGFKSENNIVTEIVSSKVLAEGYIELPKGFEIYKGANLLDFDENYKRIIKKIDKSENLGIWFDINTKDAYTIEDENIFISTNWTKKAPKNDTDIFWKDEWKTPEEVLNDSGLEDVRGEYYHKRTKGLVDVDSIFSLVSDEYTKKKPEHYTDVWDYKIDEWVEDIENKLLYDQQVERIWRDKQLSTVVDLYQLPLLWEELSETTKTVVKEYRKNLLDYPQQKDFPYGERPQLPEVLA